MNNQMEWKCSVTDGFYNCLETGDAEIPQCYLSIYDEFVSLLIIFNDGTDLLCRAFNDVTAESPADEIFPHALAKVIDLNSRSQKLEEVKCKYGGEEIAHKYIWEILLATSQNKLEWTQTEITAEEMFFEDEPTLEKYIGHVSDITKFQTKCYKCDELETYVLYYFNYDGSWIKGRACILEIKNEKEQYATYTDVNEDIDCGAKTILYKLYDEIIKYIQKRNASHSFELSKRISKLQVYARSKRNCLIMEEILEFFADYNLDAKQIEKIVAFLENKNIDVLQISDNIDAGDCQRLVKKHVPANKYATEEERIATRKESQKKYRRKINKTNEFITDKTIDAANTDPYAKQSADMELLQNIFK